MESALYVWLVGLVHRLISGALSSWQRTVETASLVEKVKLAEACVVGLAGSDVASIVTEIGNGSSTIAVTVPVAVGCARSAR